VATLAEHLRQHFGDASRILFIPYALADYDAYMQMIIAKGLHAGYEIEGIHQHGDPQQAVFDAEALYIGGGNTFRLLHALYRRDLLGVIRERVFSGMPYMGVSAGANVACPTMMTTNDMPIVMPPRFDALGLVPFQINAHYFAGHTYVKTEQGYVEHFGETRDERINQYHENNDRPVVGLWEGGILRVDHEAVTLHATGARVFRQGQAPLDVEPGTRLDDLLVSAK
jgi:dipeptidase E